MNKECCSKIKDNILDSCTDCILKLSELAENLGYDKDSWIKHAINQIPTKEENFECVSINKLQDMVTMIFKRYNDIETELGSLFNDVKYAIHDIQAPVRSIRSFSEMILDMDLDCDKNALDYLNRIHNASVRVTDMLNDMKDIMILGKQKSEKVKIINFSQIIKDVNDNLHELIEKRSAKIFVDMKNAPKFKSNVLRWTRILQNIISNGIIYNKSDNPIVKIWFEEGKIFIKDNGMGVPPNKFETIFELFTRLTDRQKMGDGTGAGLFMCRRFLEMDGFSICVDSSDDKGTIFVISFPEKFD